MNELSANTVALTRNQSLVLGTLSGAGEPLSAYAILDEVRAEGIRAPQQVYRALDTLLERGLVHRLESLNAFVVCSHPDCENHGTIAFAICDTCGKATEFSPDKAAARLKDWAGREDFRLKNVTIELKGTCRACIQA